MLNAFLHGKKRGTGTEGESLIDDFKGAEDTLTASVFERILYLPDPVVGKILLGRYLPANEAYYTKLDMVEFWPKYKLNSNRNIEPDIVFHFSNPKVILIVEAKRWDNYCQQNPKQLSDEWRAVRNQHTNVPIWLMAVGGFLENKADHLKKIVRDELADTDNLMIEAVPWYTLYKNIEDTTACLSSSWQERIVSDIAESLKLHGVMPEPPSWLKDLIASNYRGIREASINYLLSL